MYSRDAGGGVCSKVMSRRGVEMVVDGHAGGDGVYMAPNMRSASRKKLGEVVDSEKGRDGVYVAPNACSAPRRGTGGRGGHQEGGNGVYMMPNICSVMSVARSHPLKTRYSTPEVSAIKSAH